MDHRCVRPRLDICDTCFFLTIYDISGGFLVLVYFLSMHHQFGLLYIYTFYKGLALIPIRDVVIWSRYLNRTLHWLAQRLNFENIESIVWLYRRLYPLKILQTSLILQVTRALLNGHRQKCAVAKLYSLHQSICSVMLDLKINSRNYLISNGV